MNMMTSYFYSKRSHKTGNSVHTYISKAIENIHLHTNLTNNRDIPLFRLLADASARRTVQSISFNIMVIQLIVFYNSLATITMASVTPNRRIMVYGL